MSRDINLIKINETYIKFDFEFTQSNKSLIKEAYFEYVRNQSKEILKNRQDIIIAIEYDKGSLKTRIIAWGTAIYVGVAAYGSFRAGLRDLLSDSKDFSEYIVTKLTDDPNIDNEDIIRIQKRTGIPGRLNDIYIEVDSLQRNINNLTPNQVQQRLNNIKQDIANICPLLNIDDRTSFLNELPAQFTNNIPEPQENKILYLENRYGLKVDEDIEILEE